MGTQRLEAPPVGRNSGPGARKVGIHRRVGEIQDSAVFSDSCEADLLQA